MTPQETIKEMVRTYVTGAWYCDSTPNELLVEFMDSTQAAIDSDGVCRWQGRPLADYRIERFIAFIKLHYPQAVDFEANSERRRQELRLTPEQRKEMIAQLREKMEGGAA